VGKDKIFHYCHSEYFVSRFQNMDIIENAPRTKLTITLIIRMFAGNVPITILEETNLYLI